MKKLMKSTIIATIIFIILYVLLFLFVDKSTALYCRKFIGTNLFVVSKYISYLASGNVWMMVILALLIGIIMHDYFRGKTAGSRFLLYVVMTVIVASIVGGGLKFLLARHRPIMLYKHHLYGFHFFSRQWALNSTPSGHSFRIFALMGSLGIVFKRWRWWLLAVAVCVGLSRIIVHAHYPSDVLFGAYVGLLSAYWVRPYFKK